MESKISHLAGDLRVKKTPKDDRASSSMGAEVELCISDAELLRIMECPVCNEFPAPPIFSCEKGHFTCNSCIMLLEACSLCEAPYTKVRNFALESIIENSKFKCRNVNLGCDRIVSGGELNQHVADCLYRPLVCKEPDCLKDNLSPSDFFNHMISRHHGCFEMCSPKLVDGKLAIKLTQNEDCENVSPYYIRLQDPDDKESCTIIIFSKRYRTFMCWWASCLEPKKMQEYGISLTLDNLSENDHMSVSWKLPFQPIWKDFDEVRDMGRCAVLPDTHLIPYVEKGSWNLQVEITKKNYVQWNTLFQHYYPLLLLVAVGIIAVILTSLLDSDVRSSESMKSQIVRENSNIPGVSEFNQSFTENIDTTHHNIRDKVSVSKEYVGYRGYYFKQH